MNWLQHIHALFTIMLTISCLSFKSRLSPSLILLRFPCLGKADSSAAAAAYDSVVNQLLTKMDGLRYVLIILHLLVCFPFSIFDIFSRPFQVFKHTRQPRPTTSQLLYQLDVSLEIGAVCWQVYLTHLFFLSGPHILWSYCSINLS